MILFVDGYTNFNGHCRVNVPDVENAGIIFVFTYVPDFIIMFTVAILAFGNFNNI